MSGDSVEAPGVVAETTDEESTSAAVGETSEPVVTTPTGETSPAAPIVATVIPEGKGEIVISVYSAEAITMREIYFHNPYRVGQEREWIKVYEGEKPVGAGQTVRVFTASLSPITYDKVRVRAITATGIVDEREKDMDVTVTAKTSTPVTIAF